MAMLPNFRDTQKFLERAIDLNPTIVSDDTPVRDAIATMSQNLASYILISSSENLLGIFTERDVVKLTASKIPLEKLVISEVMTKNLITVSIAQIGNIFDLLAVFRAAKIRHLPILDEREKLLGVVSGESLRAILKPTDLLQMGRVSQIMTANVITAPTAAPVIEVALQMATHRKSCVVICLAAGYAEAIASNQPLKPLGIITERDIVKLTASGIELAQTSAETVMSFPLLPVDLNANLWQANQIMQQHRIRRLVVVNERGYLAGIITQSNLLQALDPAEMYSTIEILQQSITEKTQELQKVNEQMQQEILQRQKTEEELRQARQFADRSNQSKSEFISNMSHELRTPLNAILGFTQLLNRDSSLKPEHQEYIEIINRSGEHLLNLINNILEMSKIEVGRLIVNKNTFNLYEMLNKLEEMLKLQAEKKGLQLIFDIDANTPQYIQTDESKLRQILINLIGNGIKFTTEGGVTLRIKKAPSLKEEEENNNSRLLLEVEDTGSGISPDEMEYLFKDFMQTETGRKSSEGTGLGLIISRKLVQLLGGDVKVTSVVGKGSIFKFDLQINIPDPVEIDAKQTIRKAIGLEPGQPEYRILVVDDRLESRFLLVKLLASIGFLVREAENGMQAIDIWSSWEPHLIWMDMRMPVLDGYEATKQIKTHLKGQATVIIALTASAFEEERSLVLSAGCDDFVAKPFREQVILEKIEQYLGVRYSYDECTTYNLENGKSNSSFYIDAADFQWMPLDWVNKLYNAADAVNNDRIFQLLANIPDEHNNLSKAIAHLVNNFRCDKIIDLIEEFRNRG